MKETILAVFKTAIILMFLSAIASIGYEAYDEYTNPSEPYDPTICEKPKEIPDTLSGGGKVYWDRSWHESYLNSDVYIIHNEDGSVKAVGRFTNY